MKHFFLLTLLVASSTAVKVFTGAAMNFCGQRACCTTQTCNNCANNCHLQCSSELCTSNCIENCIQAVPVNCDGGTCNYCGGNQCCSTDNCNVCAQSCGNGCSTLQCRDNCIQNCVQRSCNGDNCNICSGSQCCNSEYCNRCANICNHQCATHTCRTNCINKCIETTPSCTGENCNICVGGECCSSNSCNNCVNKCYTTDTGCTQTCVRDCIQPEPIRFSLPLPEKCENWATANNHSDVTNVTTNLHVRNTVNNTNLVNIPIQVNNTNINNINGPTARHNVNTMPFVNPKLQSKPYYPFVVPRNGTNSTNTSCCYVLHPRECFPVQVNQTERQIRCIRRRHRECSPLCTSPVVLIAPQQYPRPSPQQQLQPRPLPPQQQQCHYTQQYPWVYCGNYQKHDCGNCYYCGEDYEPQRCANQQQCPEICRRNLFQSPQDNKLQPFQN